MDMLGKISRRCLTKGLAASGAMTAFSALSRANAISTGGSHSIPSFDTTPPQRLRWKEVYSGVWCATLAAPESFAPVSSRLLPPQTTAFERLPRVIDPPLSDLQGMITSRGCTVNLPLLPGEGIYGLGLQLMSFAQRGKKKVTRVNADPKVDSGDSHAPVPFYVTTRGIGVLVDTARYTTFYFGDARPKPSKAAQPVLPGSLEPSNTHLKKVDLGQITIEIPRAPGIRIYLFAGPTMLEAVQRYNVFSGGGVVPPEWGLGFWYRPSSKATKANVLELAAEFRERKIPCDVIGLEAGWQTHAYPCTFAWSEDRFPDPGGFLREISDMQYKVNLWEHAFTHPTSHVFSPLLQHSGNYGVWEGIVPDFASKDAREIFGDFHGNTLVNLGVSGFKLDECDNSDFTGGWSFPELSRFPSGIDGEQMHSVFGLRYQHTILEQFNRRNRPTYCLARSSGALAAPYPFVLYSDLYNHRDYIRALVNSGFSGLLWCPEVRDAASSEDLLRRLQSAVFSPLAMVNGWYLRNPPWKQFDSEKNNSGNFMEDWQQVESRCREIIGWRMQLVPYLSAAFQRYAEDGTPPFRALVLDYPTDERFHAIDDAYLLGDRMLVAPLFAGEASRKIFVPKGSSWHDFWTGEVVQGGAELTVLRSTEKIPVYVKAGSIIPWANVSPFAGHAEGFQLTARVYGDGSLPFVLRVGEQTLRLDWNQEDGRENTAEGIRSATGYIVHEWRQIGPIGAGHLKRAANSQSAKASPQGCSLQART
jgi:alpha-D-xyloside xylohydrolase